LNLTRRNIGVVILSAGVVDDTTGWLILSLIAGAAGMKGGGIAGMFSAIFGTAVFVAGAAFALYPALRPAFRIATQRFQSRDTDLVLMLVVPLVCAALTDQIGLHAVAG